MDNKTHNRLQCYQPEKPNPRRRTFISDPDSAIMIHRACGAPNVSRMGNTSEEREAFFACCHADWTRAFNADAALREEFHDRLEAFLSIMASRLDAGLPRK